VSALRKKMPSSSPLRTSADSNPTLGIDVGTRPALARRYDDAHERWSPLYSLVRLVPGTGPILNPSDSMS